MFNGRASVCYDDKGLKRGRAEWPGQKYMRIFVSYSHQDEPAVDKIISRLEAEGHEIWVDSRKLRIGDNIQRKIQEGLAQADALLVVISHNSFRSRWVQQEFSAIALQQISKRESRILPVKIDQSDVPSYLADRLYLDLSDNFDAGLERLVEELRAATPESLATLPPGPITSTSEGRLAQIEKLSEALRRGRLTLVCGAGVSVEAGIPAWGDLLIRLLGTMMERIQRIIRSTLRGRLQPSFSSGMELRP